MKHTTSAKAHAQIIYLPRKRGRPRLPKQEKDLGTPELIAKRKTGETSEVLDICLERQLISHKQHWCGIHLRWLYTVRFGVPTIRATDPGHLGGIENKPVDLIWYSDREREYNEALLKLKESGLAALVMGVCIYNECPGFLKLPPTQPVKSNRHKEIFLSDLREGLDILASLWRHSAIKSI